MSEDNPSRWMDSTELQHTLRYKQLFETARDAVLLFDLESQTLTDVNPFFCELTGYAREQLIGRMPGEIEAFQNDPDLANILGEAKRRDGAVRKTDINLTTTTGGIVQVEIVANRFSAGDEQLIQMNVRDVSERQKAVRDLRYSEERFRLFVESVRDYALFQMDLSGRITTWNAGAERLLGYSEDEIIGELGHRLFTPEDVASGEADREINTARTKGRAEDERWHIRKDGTRFFASGVLTAVQNDAGQMIGLAKVMRDITERKNSDEQLRASLREKEVLLKEIHHRVKNNLQIITSLFNLQTEFLADDRVRALLLDMNTRVRSIASIHETLFSAADLSRINFADYLNALTQDVASVYSERARRVKVVVNAVPALIEITQAVPCGLIVNELLTNAFKHAFPKARPGHIQIQFSCNDAACVLSVADDGIGIPADVNLSTTKSMGLQLIALLIQQLRGTVKINRDRGTEFVFQFSRHT